MALPRGFPLGSTNQVIALDDVGHYAGIVIIGGSAFERTPARRVVARYSASH